MGRLIHCLGMFLRDMTNKRNRRREWMNSEDFDPHIESDRIAIRILIYAVILSFVGLLITSAF